MKNITFYKFSSFTNISISVFNKLLFFCTFTHTHIKCSHTHTLIYPNLFNIQQVEVAQPHYHQSNIFSNFLTILGQIYLLWTKLKYIKPYFWSIEIFKCIFICILCTYVPTSYYHALLKCMIIIIKELLYTYGGCINSNSDECIVAI